MGCAKMAIRPYDYQKMTNIKEHNEIIQKLNEVIDVVNSGGTDIDVYTKAEINARLLDVVARVEGYTDEVAQPKLTAGPGITIENNIISAVGVDPGSGMLPFTNFSAGSIVGDASEDGRIYAVESGHGKVLGWEELKERLNDDELAIGAKQNKLTAGQNITIENDVISANITVDAYTKEETDAKLSTKQNKLTAGRNITFQGDVINADVAIDAYTKQETDTLLNQKQIKLIPGTGINLDEAGNISASGQIDAYTKAETNNLLAQKQNNLVSGSNIKTINNQSLLGAGNIDIGPVAYDDAINPQSRNAVQNRVIYTALQAKQNTLVSGSNIKTINGNNILGSGNIDIEAEAPEYRLTNVAVTQPPNRITLTKDGSAVSQIPTYVPEIAIKTIHAEDLNADGTYTYNFTRSYSALPVVSLCPDITGHTSNDAVNYPFIDTLTTSNVKIRWGNDSATPPMKIHIIVFDSRISM